MSQKSLPMGEQEFWDAAILAIANATCSRQHYKLDAPEQDTEDMALYADALLRERQKR